MTTAELWEEKRSQSRALSPQKKKPKEADPAPASADPTGWAEQRCMGPALDWLRGQATETGVEEWGYWESGAKKTARVWRCPRLSKEPLFYEIQPEPKKREKV